MILLQDTQQQDTHHHDQNLNLYRNELKQFVNENLHSARGRCNNIDHKLNNEFKNKSSIDKNKKLVRSFCKPIKISDKNLIVDKFNIKIYPQDLNTLDSPNMLNDIIINFYLKLLCDSFDNYHYFALDSLFFQKFENNLNVKNINMVKPWLDKSGITNQKLILLPICLCKHWRLVTFDFETLSIKYYDSYFDSSPKIASFAKTLLEILITVCFPNQLTNLKKWKYNVVQSLAKQNNNFDCGVFTLMYARCIVRNDPFDFNLNSSLDFRNHLINEISNCKIDQFVKLSQD